jgi:hypothetical protein
MEKSKLKISEISAGDWMSINGKPVEIVAVSELNGSVVYFEEEVEDMVEVSIDAVFPIPLTHEIMKTYGFVADRTFPKYVTYTYHVFKEKDFERNGCKYNTDYCVSVDMDYESDKVFEVSVRNHSREGIFNIKQTKTNEPYFLHELQHAMRDCRVEERKVLL